MANQSTYAFGDRVTNNPANATQDMLGFDILNAGAIETGIFEADDVIAKAFIGVGGPVGTVRLTANGSDPQIYNLPLTEGTSGQFLAMSSGNQLTFVNGTPGSAVDSMNGLIGALSITSADDSITVVAAGSTIDLSVPPPVNVVDSFNSAIGNVNLVSSGSITFTGTNPFFADVTYPNLSATTKGSYMAWDSGAYISVPAPVTSLNGLNDDVTLLSTDNTVNILPGDGTLDLSINFPGVVTSLNGNNGDLSLASSDNSITISGQNITVTNPVPGNLVNTVNGIDAAVTVRSPDNSISVNPSGQFLELTLPGASVITGSVTINPFSRGKVLIATGTALSISNTLTSGDAGCYVWLKNGNNSVQDITLSGCAGATILHGTNSANNTNGQSVIVFWNGTTLTAY